MLREVFSPKRLWTSAVLLVASADSAVGHAEYVAAPTGTTEWRFNDVTGSGNGAIINPAFGPGTMTQVGALTGNAFGTTGNTYNGDVIPNINGNSSGIVYTIGSNSTSGVGYRTDSNVDGPLSGHRNFTMIFDMFIPTVGVGTYTALYQGSATNAGGNDVDGYLINTTQGTAWNAASGQYATGNWERIAFTRDETLGLTSFYRNGVFQASGPNQDYVFDAGNALPFWIFSDDNGNHSDSAWANFAFVPDLVLDADTISRLGVADAQGIFNVPEPASIAVWLLASLLALALCWRRWK